MTSALALGRRALREAGRTPEALFPTLFIPLFILVVNVGQIAKIFPSTSTEFLKGQSYAAFQLPVSLLLAASFGSAALFLVEDIEGGYFDKLRAAPVSRTAIVLGVCSPKRPRALESPPRSCWSRCPSASRWPAGPSGSCCSSR